MNLWADQPPGGTKMQTVMMMVQNHRPAVEVSHQSLPQGAPGWSDAGSRALSAALGELQDTVGAMASQILASTKRGLVLKAMVEHQGIVRTACMTVAVRDKLREAARIISEAGHKNARRVVYAAALQAVGEDRPEGATVH